jgi:hypothetical protein
MSLTRVPTSILIVSTALLSSSLATAEDASTRTGYAGRVLLNKPEIAEATYKKLRGLRDLDNPHIREGLLLRNLQVDPNRSQVDLDVLREARIRGIEERGVDHGAVPAELIPPRRARPSPVQLTRPAGRERFDRPSSRGAMSWMVLFTACVLLIVGALLRVMR